jgi:hypothetical protein
MIRQNWNRSLPRRTVSTLACLYAAPYSFAFGHPTEAKPFEGSRRQRRRKAQKANMAAKGFKRQKTEAHKARNKVKKLAKREHVDAAELYVVPKALLGKHVDHSVHPVETNAASSLGIARTAWAGAPQIFSKLVSLGNFVRGLFNGTSRFPSVSGKHWSLQELIDDHGFALIKWDGRFVLSLSISLWGIQADASTAKPCCLSTMRGASLVSSSVGPRRTPAVGTLRAKPWPPPSKLACLACTCKRHWHTEGGHLRTSRLALPWDLATR